MRRLAVVALLIAACVPVRLATSAPTFAPGFAGGAAAGISGLSVPATR